MPPDVFVGRVGLLQAADHWLVESAAGSFRLLLARGPAGIGKTALSHQIQTRAGRRGFRVVSGACHEDLGLPYLPIASALHQLSPDAGRAIDGLLATDTADHGDRRLTGLLLELIEAVFSVAGDQPVLFAVDDLHWCDQATLRILEMLAFNASLRPVALTVLLTHRPLLPQSPVGPSLRRLGREAAARDLVVPALDELETNQLLRRLAPAPPSREVVAAVLESSEGNPLLTRLALEQLLARGNGRVPSPHSGLPLPTDLDAGLVAWAEAVGQPAADLLLLASVLGDGSALDDLAAVARLPAPDFDVRLDELVGAGLLRLSDRFYVFGHPQLRTVCVVRAGSRQAMRLHARVADRLEERHGVEAAPLIAHHLERAGPVDPERLVRWVMLAADQALGQGAWADAAAHYETALASGVALERPPAETYLLAATAHFRNFNIPAAMLRANEAVDLARAAGDFDRWSEAVRLLTTPAVVATPAALGRGIETPAADDFLAFADGATPAQRANVLCEVAQVQFVANDVNAGLETARTAYELAAGRCDDGQMSEVEVTNALLHLAVLDLDAAVQHAEEGRRLADRAQDPWRASFNIGRLALARWLRGDLDGADAAAAETCRLVSRHGDWVEFSLGATIRAGVAAAQGRFDDAERHGADAEAAFHRTEYPWTPALLYPDLAWTHHVRGDVAGAERVAAEWAASGAGGSWRGTLVARAVADSRTAVLPELVSAAARRPPPGPLNLNTLAAAVAHVDLADLADRSPDGSTVAALEEVADRGVAFIAGWPGTVARRLAMAARRAGDLASAERWLSRGLEIAEAAGAAPEVAEVRLEWGRLALARGPSGRAEAVRMLGTAASTFDELGMVPLVAETRRILLDAAPASVPDPVVRYLLVTDLVNSTGLNAAVGDARWVEVMGEHDRVVRAALVRRGGVQFKHTGDGVCAWFTSASAAVRCALDMQEGLDEANVIHPDVALVIRAGVADGRPIGEAGDLFGLDVALVSRVCQVATGRQVLVTGPVALDAAATGLTVRRVGRFELKGFAEPVVLHEAMSVTKITTRGPVR